MEGMPLSLHVPSFPTVLTSQRRNFIRFSLSLSLSPPPLPPPLSLSFSSLCNFSLSIGQRTRPGGKLGARWRRLGRLTIFATLNWGNAKRPFSREEAWCSSAIIGTEEKWRLFLVIWCIGLGIEIDTIVCTLNYTRAQ